MAKREAKAKAKTIGAFGEDLKTNRPVQPLPLAPGQYEVGSTIESIMPDDYEPPKPENQPKTWPFNKSYIVNEKKEMAHVSRLVNMKHNNPGVVKVTKVVVYDCLSRQVTCRDYKIEYNKG